MVLCGATSGYTATVDLRHLWIHQKRIQGSHGGTAQDAVQFLKFCEKHSIRPLIYAGYGWDSLPKAHAELEKGDGICGKLVIHIVNGGAK